MYAFAVFKKANYIFSIESVPAYIGGQIFLLFFKITVPKSPLPVETSERYFFIEKIFSDFFLKTGCVLISQFQ